MKKMKVHHAIIDSLLTDLIDIYYDEEFNEEMTTQEFLKEIVKQMYSQLAKELIKREEEYIQGGVDKTPQICYTIIVKRGKQNDKR